jgi:DNA-binding protein H-NS
MTQSYKQIQKQIEALQRQADKLRQQEVVGVIARIKIAVAHYGLTAQQLGLGSGSGATAVAKSKAKKGGAARSAKYADGQGNEWSGRGPRPHWLRDALSAGKTLEEFAVGGAGAGAVASHEPAVAAKKRAGAKSVAGKKRKSTVLYRDQSGNSWSGMGPRPRWLKEALEAGRTLEELTAN